MGRRHGASNLTRRVSNLNKRGRQFRNSPQGIANATETASQLEALMREIGAFEAKNKFGHKFGQLLD
jgi:hypothetical protein